MAGKTRKSKANGAATTNGAHLSGVPIAGDACPKGGEHAWTPAHADSVEPRETCSKCKAWRPAAATAPGVDRSTCWRCKEVPPVLYKAKVAEEGEATEVERRFCFPCAGVIEDAGRLRRAWRVDHGT